MLNNPKTFKKYDKADIAFGIERLSEQVQIAFEATQGFKVPSQYKMCDSIVVAGMGGSSLGAHVIEVGCAKKLKKPIIRIRDYNLPSWVSSKTLVVLSSFSGTTEEVLSMAKQALKQKAKIMVITTGGELLKLTKKNKWPVYKFEPGDLAKEPRLGLGFMTCGLLGMLESAGFLKISKAEKQSIIQAMSDVVDSCALDIDLKENPAKQVALALKDKPMLIVSSEHLVGCAHVITNQVNENAKQFAKFNELPELNHHLMEGLTFPKQLFSKFTVLMIKSKLYNQQTKKRYPITAEVFEKLGAQVIEYEARGESELEEVGEMLQFGSFMSYYLAMLNKVNPSEIPHVDWFKEQIKR